MSALPQHRFTPEEYLQLEEAATHKSQYVDGEIFAMAGGEPWHNQVAYNIAGELRNLLRGRACSGFTSDTSVRIKAADMYTYPDVSALCGKPVFETADKPRSLLNPQVIFEVLSPSTEAYDRGRKFESYRLLDSLTDYVLVTAERPWVEIFTRRGDGSWLYRDYQVPGSSVPLASLGCELPLCEIYDRVEFPGAG